MTHSQSIAIIPYTVSLISILICLFSKTFLDNPKNDPKYCHFDTFLPFSMASFLRSFMLINYLENKIRRIISTIRRYFSIIIMVSNSKKVVSFINAFKGENELIALVTKEERSTYSLKSSRFDVLCRTLSHSLCDSYKRVYIDRPASYSL